MLCEHRVLILPGKPSVVEMKINAENKILKDPTTKKKNQEKTGLD